MKSFLPITWKKIGHLFLRLISPPKVVSIILIIIKSINETKSPDNFQKKLIQVGIIILNFLN